MMIRLFYCSEKRMHKSFHAMKITTNILKLRHSADTTTPEEGEIIHSIVSTTHP